MNKNTQMFGISGTIWNKGHKKSAIALFVACEVTVAAWVKHLMKRFSL